jgi:DNA-binding response OmpR family regulator
MTPFESAPSSPSLRDQLTRAIAALDRGDVDEAQSIIQHAATENVPRVDLTVTSDGSSYRVNNRRVSLMRRGNLRRILVALVDNHGRPLSRDEVLAAGWPRERMRPESGAMRVHTAICRLRKTGLGDLLITRDDGYLIDPRITVRREV